ncbi:MAG TPA: carboxylesterase [Gammaproteobacteria bacterium]|jgi:phospholipase/carboxylesterase
MSSKLDAVEIATGPEPQFAVIWLHGLGADGHDFEPIVGDLELPAAIRYVFPHAPRRPVTINQGMVMRAWYDILALDRSSVEDEDGIRWSERAVNALIEIEVTRGIPTSHIMLAGFSQGAAVALYTALRYPEPLCGAIVLSGYLPLRYRLGAERAAAGDSLPIFMAHGSADPVVPEGLGLDSRRHLEALGYRVEWHRYPMAHNVCMEEVRDLKHWMARRIVEGTAGGR